MTPIPTNQTVELDQATGEAGTGPTESPSDSSPSSNGRRELGDAVVTGEKALNCRRGKRGTRCKEHVFLGDATGQSSSLIYDSG